MAEKVSFWHRLSRLSKTLLILLSVDLCFLIVSLGITAWSMSALTATPEHDLEALQEGRLGQVKAYIALISIMIALLCMQILFCASYLFGLCGSYRLQTVNYDSLHTDAKWFSLLIGLISLLTLIFTIASAAYASVNAMHSSGFIALCTVFWILSAGISIVVTLIANQLRKVSAVQLESSTTIMAERKIVTTP